MSESGYSGLNDFQDFGIGLIGKIGVIVGQTFLLLGNKKTRHYDRATQPPACGVA
jgi:hypothetical protein